MEKKIVPTREQKQEGQYIIDLLHDKYVNQVTLKGRAGTGKTTLTEHIVGMMGRRQVVLVAPTHVAVDLMRKKFHHLDAVFSTTASLLKSKKRVDLETGKVWFEPTADEDDRKLLIVHDESSMLDRGSVEKLHQTFPKAKFLYIGDKGQLPPIGDEDYCVLDQYRGGELTENHRCGKGNALFDYIEELYEGKIYIPEPVKDRIEIINRNDIEECDVNVVYHNETARKLNNVMLDRLYNNVVEPGVRLVARTTFIEQSGSKIYNSEQMTIDSLKSRQLAVRGFPPTIQDVAAQRDIQNIDLFDVISQKRKFTFSIDPNLDKLKEALRVKNAWKEYFWLSDQIPDVRLGYAVTAHCTQGLTLPTTTLVWNDLLNGPDNIRKALFYVAASRASEKIKILLK